MVTSSTSRRSRRRVNPWLRLLVPIVLVLAATAAIWGPKIGWFGLGDAGLGGGSSTELLPEQGTEPGTAPEGNPAPDASPARPAEAVPVTVDYVHDGDTLFVYPEDPNADRIKVRLLGIDTPEVGENAECFGAEATEALRALLPEGTTAWTLSDVNPRDKYDRSLLLMWTDDGRFVNNELLLSGAATVLQIDPNRAHTELFRSSEASAQAGGAGLWGAC
ncbi:hypothetical protein GY24_07355 [Microterricola pindariensis]|uniref:TNase-like domain-containing protein n=1 Tax=Microterricola pindariensis TaxID=478010 RepID=A0ABX5AWB5_9MICO|nr:hypothetical protein GY24_07355 [Microterricola pindariensis]